MHSSSLLYSEFITHFDITSCAIVHDVTNNSYIIYGYAYTYMIMVFGRLKCTDWGVHPRKKVYFPILYMQFHIGMDNYYYYNSVPEVDKDNPKNKQSLLDSLLVIDL